MDKKLKTNWIKALRSGKYKQGRGALCRNEDGGRFCCLGVLCNVAKLPKRKTTNLSNLTQFKSTKQAKQWNDADLPKFFRTNVCKISSKQQSSLIYLNDTDRASFSEIADWIKENL